MTILPELASVSVVIPCYRCADTIVRAVASVAAQTLRPAEVILVEDCSNDETLAVLNQLQSEYPLGWIKVIPLSFNVGAGEARNAGWDAARGSYIAFLDADDSWHTQKIAIQYGWMSAHPDITLTGHECQEVNGGAQSDIDNIHAANVNGRFEPVSHTALLVSNRFSTRSVMLKREIPYRFAPGKRYSEDYLLWTMICLDGHSCYQSSLPLAFLFKASYGGGGLSAQLWRMQQGEISTYCQLYRSDRIGFLIFMLVYFLSWIKYGRRILVVKLRKCRDS